MWPNWARVGTPKMAGRFRSTSGSPNVARLGPNVAQSEPNLAQSIPKRAKNVCRAGTNLGSENDIPSCGLSPADFFHNLEVAWAPPRRRFFRGPRSSSGSSRRRFPGPPSPFGLFFPAAVFIFMDIFRVLPGLIFSVNGARSDCECKVSCQTLPVVRDLPSSPRQPTKGT